MNGECIGRAEWQIKRQTIRELTNQVCPVNICYNTDGSNFHQQLKAREVILKIRQLPAHSPKC